LGGNKRSTKPAGGQYLGLLCRTMTGGGDGFLVDKSIESHPIITNPTDGSIGIFSHNAISF
jgi:hypothetical protein